MIKLSEIKHKILNIEYNAIPKGHTCVIGENGCGKSTLLKLLSGTELPKKGTICLDGKKIRNLNVGYVPEYPERQIVFEDVFDEIISPLRFSFQQTDTAEERTRNLAELLDISDLLNKKTRNLSGGEKAFVSLAVALIMKPEILVLDEPDSHMDFETSEKFLEILKNSETDYVIHCTQNMNAAQKSDYLIFMENGRIKFSGTPDFVYEKMDMKQFFPLSRRLKDIA